MKVALAKGQIMEALFRDLSQIREDLFELKITVTPKNQKPYNIALGFSADELKDLNENITVALARFERRRQ